MTINSGPSSTNASAGQMSNRITVALWVIVLSSHLLLLPKFVNDMRKKSA
ncbi:MAG: hypothetical protein ABI456_19815 [Ktedonobacteraceae bacterium]|nr:hypothetical protein [Chloroflexota bacterium]